MKTRKFALVGMIAMLGILVTSCGEKVPQYDGTEVQGVSETEIWVGNTAATTGAYAEVGVPFNAGMEAVFAQYNAAGGFDGKQVKLKHYDDGFDGAKGLTYTKQLVEDDKVFALVGHFGTNTVTQTVDYIKSVGVPMVYAATGISALYQEGAEGYNKSVMSVQPIYDAEGRVLLARALASKENNKGLGATKVGVISTTDDAGEGMLAGVKRQAEELPSSIRKSIKYVEVSADAGTDYSAAVNILKTAGCDVIIAACNQAPLSAIVKQMKASSYDAHVITSYVSANTTTLGDLVAEGSITENRRVYTTAWLDVNANPISYTAWYSWSQEAPAVFNPVLLSETEVAALIPFPSADLTAYGMTCYVTVTGQVYYKQILPTFSQDYWDFYETVVAAGYGIYMSNSYAMAGYIAGKMFVEGLKRVKEAGKELTWKNYIDEMEDGVLPIAMGGTINYADGNRFGVTDLALNTISLTPDYTGAYALQGVDGISTLDSVWAEVPTE